MRKRFGLAPVLSLLFSFWFSLGFSLVSLAEEFPEAGMGETHGISLEEKSSTENDRFRLGGALWSEVSVYGLDSQASQRDYFSNTNQFWLYGEGKLRDDIRALIRGKLLFDSTARETVPNLITGAVQKRYQPDLEEMKIQFSAKKTVFFTLGKQKIKWGSGQIWNPSDFVNVIKRDPLRASDERTGVVLVKSHVPVGSANLYSIELIEGASRVSEVGQVFRAEVPIATSELALSAAFRKDRKSLLALDWSSALGSIDVYTEATYSSGSDLVFYESTDAMTTGSPFRSYREEKRGFYKGVIGANYEFTYADSRSITAGLEYFYNGEGYSETGNTPWVFANGAYVPFYLGRQYFGSYIQIPNPGSWRDVSFTVIGICNLSDESALFRINSDLVFARDLKVNLGFSHHFGKRSGEFRLGGQSDDLIAGVRVDF